jgi:divinyl protochlorophyllide a 8-vinyl-reductase
MAADAKAGIGHNERVDVRTGGQLVGPNAILQTAQALVELHGTQVADAVFGKARIDGDQRHPESMVDAGTVRRLNQAIRACLPETDASVVMHKAGELTGRYILANRIPARVMLLLEALPSLVSPHLLMMAIRRHSWTFAGSSRVSITHGWRKATISIEDNPIAYGPCVWHMAVFNVLLGPLAGKALHVVEEGCCADGKNCCRFIVRW